MAERDLIAQALDEKRKGNYQESIALYKTAIEHSRDNSQVYYSLAKVYYLLKEQKLSILNYIKSASLDLLYLKQNLFYKELIQNLEHKKDINYNPDIRQMYADDIENFIEFANIYDKDAKFLLFDINLNFHLGHALLDFNEAFVSNYIESKEFLNFYKDSIRGEKGDFFADFLHDIYISAGFKFLIPLINYNDLKDLSFYDNLNLEDLINLFYLQEFNVV